MKYNVCVLKRVIKKRFVMLLIDICDCRIDENEKVKRLIKRDIREKVANNFDFEINFVHDIIFFDVAKSVKENENNEINEIIIVIVTKNEELEV